MSKIKRLSISGFRRLSTIDIETRPLAVLIGANGVGKTSILDVFDLLSASATGTLSAKLTEFAGLASLLTIDHAQALSFGLSIEIAESQPPLDYRVSLSPTGSAYSITNESLYQKRQADLRPFMYIDSKDRDVQYFDVEAKKLVRPNWDYRPLETALSQVPKLFVEPEEFRNRLASTRYYHVLNVDPRSPVRLPQPMQPALSPGRNGEDLVSFLYYLRETQPDAFETLEDTLRAAFPDFEKLSFPPVAAGTIAMTWKDKAFTKPIYTHQLSEGTLRFLWLVSVLMSKESTSIILLDEPEVSLHPELLSLLAELLREAASRVQIVVATHSDRLVRYLKPKEVLVMNRSNEGIAEVTWGDHLDLDEWLKEYTLDEVWRLGRMGGRS